MEREVLPASGVRRMSRPKYTEDLLPDDWAITYRHYNRGKRGTRTITIATVLINGSAVSTGHAICAPNDRFNEQLGQTIAQGRAIKNFVERRNDQTN